MSFEEAVTGLTTNLTVNRSEQCSRCQGAGDTGGPVIVCPTCKGTGQVLKTGGRLQFSQTCSDCEGTGRRRQPCSLCNGKGTTPKTEQVKVRIPAGVDTGSRVRIPKKGHGGTTRCAARRFVHRHECRKTSVFYAQRRQHLRYRADFRAGSRARRKDRSADRFGKSAVKNSGGNTVGTEISSARKRFSVV